jgi:twinkle protein
MNLLERLADEGIRPRNHDEGDHKLTCPKCSHTRRNKTDPCLSLTIKPDGAVWKCHNCEWTGGARDPRQGPQRYHATEPRKPPVRIERRPDALPASAIAYFHDRGISEDTLRFADVGWSSSRSMVAFPFRKPGDTAMVNAKFRKLPKDGFSQIKDGEKVYWLLDKLDPMLATDLYIVEGELDALSLVEAGIPNVLSVPDGAPKTAGGDRHDKKFSFVPDCEQWIAPFQRIILAVDADGPGEALAEELARRYGKDLCWSVRWPAGIKDANEYLIQNGKAALADWCRKPKAWPIEGLYDVSDYRDAVLNLFWKGRSRGISTGFPSLDPIFTIAPGQLTVVTGIPNNGKSEFIDQVMVNLARARGWVFGVCSFENEPAEHISKMVEKWIGMPFWEGPTPRMTSYNLEKAMDDIDDHFKFIRHQGKGGPTIQWVLEKARDLVKRYGIEGLVVDPYNEIEHKRPGNMTETEYVSLMLGEMTRFAKLHGVHVFFIAHPAKMQPDNKTGQIPPPGMYDISGSANFVNKTDNGITVHRGERDGTTDIYIRKVRAKWVGQRGRATLGYNRITGVYSDLGETFFEGDSKGNGR